MSENDSLITRRPVRSFTRTTERVVRTRDERPDASASVKRRLAATAPVLPDRGGPLAG